MSSLAPSDTGPAPRSTSVTSAAAAAAPPPKHSADDEDDPTVTIC
ncbi:MAG: hypothetical protein ACR2HP_05625 [Ilumatobacteraceae bacterium]